MEYPTSGFLIVKTFSTLYYEYPRPIIDGGSIYAIPRKGVNPKDFPKRYQGIDREPLDSWDPRFLEMVEKDPSLTTPPREREAVLALFTLEKKSRVIEDFILSELDVHYIYSLLRDPEMWEIIWAVQAGAGIEVPAGACSLGFEPTWLIGDHFSAVCDCMCFPRWHGTDKQGKLFRSYFDQLNSNALFGTADEATEFLDFYRSFDWTETGEYVVAEIYSVTIPGNT